ncbi:phosphoribosyltransferase [Candidatus Micrarchaeota archaeon]|nr:phosphoribosyltransferase [Candidatus Micrarchaeota archaeon]
MFRDRRNAGAMLAAQLIRYSGKPGVIVFGIPRGGVVVAKVVADSLHLPLKGFVVRKLGAPGNPELAIGAVSHDGKPYWNEDVLRFLSVSSDYKITVLKKEFEEVRRRMKAFGITDSTEVTGQTVIAVDDGIATGATLKAAIDCWRHQGPCKIIVAVPVCSPDTAKEFRSMADEFICLETPSHFASVGQFYERFSQTMDEEVCALLE